MTATSFYPTNGRVEYFIARGLFDDDVQVVVGPEGEWRRMLRATRVDELNSYPPCKALILNTDFINVYRDIAEKFINVVRPAFIVPYPDFEKTSCLDAPFRLQYRVLDNYRFWKRMFARGEIDAAKVNIL